MGDLLCFRCGQSGHLRHNCPNRTRGTNNHPPAAPDGPPEKGKETPAPPPVREVLAAITPTEAVGNARAWADHARQLLGLSVLDERPLIGPARYCTDPADVYDSQFRRDYGLAPAHQCQLRQLAAAQLSRGEDQ